MGKIYFKQSIDSWLYWHTNADNKHLTLRLAGKPSFLLERYIEKYGEKEWQLKYQELLVMLKEIWDTWMSPFVLYINDIK